MSEKTYSTESIGVEFDLNNKTYCQAIVQVLSLWGQEGLVYRVRALSSYSKETHERRLIDQNEYEIASERAVFAAMKHIHTCHQETLKDQGAQNE